jgi:hypothetical protein
MKFTEILEQLDIDFKTEGNHCRPGWINIDCPWCGRDTQKYHLGYSLEGHYLSCWRCGPHSAIDTVQEYTGLPFHKVKKLLSDITLPRLEKREKAKGKLKIPKGVKSMKRIHRQYLRSRGFNDYRLEELWQLQGIGMAAELSWRIFIPIIYHGKTVSWTTRSISMSKKIMRYMSASLKEESMPHKSLLYGADLARKTIIINEGPTDAWAIGPGAVATLGTSYSMAQVSKMLEFEKRIVCFDTEPAAQARARKLCADLSSFPGITENCVLDAEDAASATKRELKLLRRTYLR